MDNKEPSDVGNIKVNRNDDEYREARGYSPLNGDEMTRPLKKLKFRRFEKTELVLMFLGGMLLILILLFLIYFPRKITPPGDNRIDGLTTQLKTLTTQLSNQETQINTLEQRLLALESREQDWKVFKERYERLNGSMARKLDLLAQQVDDLMKQKTAVAAAPPKPLKRKIDKSSGKSVSAKPAAASSRTRYHVVRKGDTLYSISRRYGVTVNDIRRANGLGANSVIKPDQKLILPRSKQ